ncbi:SEC-C domain-containing protein [Kingella potus]|nr:SEC-C metal-binding domain-containing protein [Kingella potus]UOP01847.1 SEC-C domain-containing protein [Kingella potus]
MARREKQTANRTAAGRENRRNDPCPCGSGKKYKACCGRS